MTISESNNCAKCGASLPTAWLSAPGSVHPCPSCGSHTRNIHLTVHEEISFKEWVDLKHKNPNLSSRQKLRTHINIGDELSMSTGRWVKKERVIDKDSNRYFERVIDPVTGELIHYKKEPLSKHKGHGYAKSKSKPHGNPDE